MKKMFGLLALLVAVLLTAAACGGAGGNSTKTGKGFNQADVKFVRQMIPHHRQAVSMAKLVQGHNASPKVKQLAEGIEAAQGPEIKTMSGWLRDWGYRTPEPSMSGDGSEMGHDMGGMESMRGMMSKRQMEDLSAIEGKAFDRMFLSMMIQHHAGAIDMAKTEQQKGKNPNAIALAEQIEKAQEGEIEQMKQMLKS